MNNEETSAPDQRQQLGGLLAAIHANTHEDKLVVNREQIHYAVYLRKSTEGEDKQQKSIGDQLQDIKERCLEPNKITNYTIIKEEKSAKEWGVRKNFRMMLTDFRSGKYQGLIAWDCSRLARNMREAGEIIDMLDKNTIKDLLFPTAYFDNTASGKMLLGMSFVLAKQYSEHLSENVLRGYRRRIQEGRYLGKLVHGYRIMDEGLLEPDDDNFLIIQQAFGMRLAREQKSLEEIAKWLNKQNYVQCYGREQVRSRTKFTNQKLSEIFRDTIYAGFLQYGQAEPVDMTECYGFEPMISAEEFMRLNKIDSIEGIGTRGNVISRGLQADILRNTVFCGHCAHKMYPTTGKGNRGKTTYVYFRCDYIACPYKLDKEENPKGAKNQLRANKVVEFAFNILGNVQFDLKKAYVKYVEDAKRAVDEESLELLSEERRARANLKEAKDSLARAKEVVADPTKADVAPYYKDDIKQLVEHDIPAYELDITDINRRKANLKQAIMTEERFLKLMQNVAVYLSKLKDLQQIDEIIRKFFSNFVITNRAVSVYEFSAEWNDVINPAWQG